MVCCCDLLNGYLKKNLLKQSNDDGTLCFDSECCSEGLVVSEVHFCPFCGIRVDGFENTQKQDFDKIVHDISALVGILKWQANCFEEDFDQNNESAALHLHELKSSVSICRKIKNNIIKLKEHL